MAIKAMTSANRFVMYIIYIYIFLDDIRSTIVNSIESTCKYELIVVNVEYMVYFQLWETLLLCILPPHDKQLQAAVRDAPWTWPAGIWLFGAGAGC